MAKIKGPILRALRKRASKTQEEIADYLGVTDSVISKWENEIQPMSYKYLFPLAEFFGIDVVDLRQILEGEIELEGLPDAFFINRNEELEPFAKEKDEISRFRTRVFESNLDTLEKLILVLLPEFMDLETRVVAVSPADFQRFHLPLDVVEDHWDAVLNSEFVLSFTSSSMRNYVFKLNL